jgi:hypothetical protein
VTSHASRLGCLILNQVDGLTHKDDQRADPWDASNSKLVVCPLNKAMKSGLGGLSTCHASGGNMDNTDKKKTLKIDLDELCSAMENSSYENEYYLDLETGDILFLSECMDDEETENLRERIDEESDRYEPIPKAESHEGYDDMRAFIATVEDEHLAELLEVAINGKGAFRRFKDVLLGYPEERERWFEFKDGRMRERVLEWLDDIGVTPSEE